MKALSVCRYHRCAYVHLNVGVLYYDMLYCVDYSGGSIFVFYAFWVDL